MKKTIDYKEELLRKVIRPLSSIEKFHRKTRAKKFVLQKNASDSWPESWKQVHYKTYPRLPRVMLHPEQLDSRVASLFLQRHSERLFSKTTFPTLNQLATLLWYAAGITRPNENIDLQRRSYPSGGARYPLELYVVAFNIKGLKKGVYHYNVLENVLELLEEGDKKTFFEEIVGGKESGFSSGHAAIFITGIFGRSEIKYRTRAYRLILLEAGHMAQNFCLLAPHMNLGICPAIGFEEKEIEKLLDIDKQKEYALYLLPLGKVA